MSLMTTLLEQAFAEAAKLPPQEQDALAAWLLEELAADQRCSHEFSKRPGVLSKLAEEALAEYRAGHTRPLDPDRL